MGEVQLREWFDKIMAHARANYEHDGWDNFVECVDFVDFVNAALRRRRGTGQPSFYTYEDAFGHYSGWCREHAEQQAEHDAEARSSW